MNNVASNIKFLRRKHRLTQDDLANKLGISRYKIGSYEEDRAIPKLSVLQHLATYFKLTLDELINAELWNKEELAQTKGFDKKGDNLRILTTIVDKSNDERLVLVPEKASAGYTSGYGDPDFIEKLPVFDLPFPELNKERTYRVFQIKGNSMMPVASGSYIICEYLINMEDVHFDTPHIVVTKDDGIVYKRIQQDKTDEKKLILKSDNPEYHAYSIQWEDVLEVWKAVGFASMQLPDAKDVSLNRLQNLVSKLNDELGQFKVE